MPRITETLSLGTMTYKAVRPQNGDTPAAFRQVDGNKPLSLLWMLNQGVTQSKSNNLTVNRVKSSLVVPRIDKEGKLQPSDRIDLTARIGLETTATDIELLRDQLVAYVSSSEFLLALSGEAQF